MKKYRAWILRRWPTLLTGLVMMLVMSTLLLFHLGTLNKGAAFSEINYLSSTHSGKNLLTDPTFLVHKLPTYILFKLGFHSIAVYRLVSVLFVAITVVSAFIILKAVYSWQVAILGSLLLLTSAWILHTGRLANPEVSFLLIMPFVLAAAWLHATTRRYRSLFVLVLGLATSFYIPGFGWLAIALIVWEHKTIWQTIKAVSWWFRTICGVLLIIGLTPLLWAVMHNPGILLSIGGLPAHISALHLVGKNLLQIPQNLLVFGPQDPTRWLGRLPILDIFSIVMMFLGLYSLRYHQKQHIIRLWAGSGLLLIILVSIGGLTTLTALIPLLYLFISAGIAFMLQQWMTVFPRNPIAHTLATTLISLTILLVSYFHIYHYFIAWPQTPATKRVFSYNLVK